MSWRLSTFATAVALFTVLAAARPDAPKEHQVAIRGMHFVPAQLTVHRGDKVRWTNEDLVPHTATASDKRFDSALIAPSASWEWTASEKGQIPYGCTVHPEMKGSVTVR